MPTRTSEDPMGARMLFGRPNLPLRTNPLRRRLHMPTRSREDKHRYRLPTPDRFMSSTPVPGPSNRPMHLPTWTDSRQLRRWLCCSRDLQLLRCPEIRERSMRVWIRTKSCLLRNRLRSNCHHHTLPLRPTPGWWSLHLPSRRHCGDLRLWL